ncbi:MAG: 4-hydroxy-tetrahydrodipicolinate reductase [Gemmataceae bacterium]|nr:4-hydroxy-tetrahydrodipicolinate reductase [Gemmataceae bacterium]
MKTKLGVNGACGRMGKRIIQLAHEDPELHLVAAVDFAAHPEQGADVGVACGLGKLDIFVSPELSLHAHPDAIIDFSIPDGTMGILKTCVDRRIPLVIATTGHTPAQWRDIEAAAHHTAILTAPNMSLVVNVLYKLVREAALALKDKGFDIEIIERHHRFKKDSPSGTALHFAKVIQDALGEMTLVHGREGQVGERTPREIGMHAVRSGDNVGEHTILFSTLGETMELVHKGHTRDAYVRGALQAAKFLATKGPGRYTMEDVLGL